MALNSDNTLISNRETIIEMVLAPFRAFAGVMERLAETSARRHALQAIAEMSDDELAASGMTRAEAINMLFARDD